jgi:hypothetical protein
LAPLVDVRATFQQRLDHSEEAVLAGAVQRLHAALLRDVDLPPFFEEIERHLLLPAVDRPRQLGLFHEVLDAVELEGRGGGHPLFSAESRKGTLTLLYLVNTAVAEALEERDVSPGGGLKDRTLLVRSPLDQLSDERTVADLEGLTENILIDGAALLEQVRGTPLLWAVITRSSRAGDLEMSAPFSMNCLMSAVPSVNLASCSIESVSVFGDARSMNALMSSKGGLFAVFAP